MGPQNAVTTAVKIPERISSLLRVARMFTPRFSAYRVPSKRALSGFISMKDNATDAITNMENNGSRSIVTPEKLPSPHITKECIPSWVEKKLSSEIADEAK